MNWTAGPRLIAHLAIATALLLGLAVGAGACSAGEDADGQAGETEKYTSDYGYSFAYPGDWQIDEEDSASVTGGAAAVDSVGVYDPDGKIVEGSYVDLVQVSVYKLNITVDESTLPGLKTDLETLLSSLESQGQGWQLIEPLTETQTAGMSGFKATYDFTMGETPVRSTFYFLFLGDTQYQLTLQAAKENWENAQPGFGVVVGSFAPVPSQ